MKTHLNLLNLSLFMVSTAIFLTTDRTKVLAIGCDTYYRVTGQIAGCTDVSTEKAQEVWLERYSICLERQLERDISVYQSQSRTYYAGWESENSDRNLEFDNISFSNLDTSPSLSTTTYRGNADFCPDLKLNNRD